jgi:hypothetical protein
MMEIMLDHLERTPDLNPLPEPEQEVLKKALSKDPTQRYRSCLAFVQALEQAVAPELGRAGTAPGMPFAEGGAARSTGYDTMIQGTGTEGSAAADPYSSRTRLGEETRPPAGWRERGAVAAGTAPISVQQQQRRKALKMMLMVVALPVVVLTAFAVVRPLMNSGSRTELIPFYDSKEKVVKGGDSGGDPNKGSSGIYLPEGYRNDGTETEKRGDKEFYKRIIYDFGDGIKIPFVLIPNVRPNDPLTFYMMENKVPILAFRKFAEKNKAFIKNDDWLKGALGKGKDLGIENPRLPVTRVGVEDAHRFAVAMGGKLPSVKQWDKAAGHFEPNHAEGPFKGPWSSEEDKNKDQIAIDRGDEGPLEIGKASKDISLLGCHDMSGNGREWTRDLIVIGSGNEREIPLDRPADNYKDRVILRGRNYVEDKPLLFTDPTMGTERPDTLGYNETRFDVGFRVVIEIPEKYQPK